MAIVAADENIITMMDIYGNELLKFETPETIA